MSAKSLKCDIILPVCDQFEFTEPCIESMIRNTDTPFRLIVINNGKNPRTRQYLNALEKRTDCETKGIPAQVKRSSATLTSGANSRA